jgi:hypothetical protein
MKIAAAIAVFGGISVVAAQPESGARRTLTVYIIDDRAHHTQSVYPAQHIATELFAPSGLRLKWRRGQPRTAPAPQDLVFIIDLADRTPEAYREDALAFSYLNDGIHITVFYDRVEKTAKQTVTNVLLGHVLAHELTHLLQGIERHSDSGVMRAKWTVEDQFAMAHRALLFTREDLRLLELGIARRQPR